MNERIIVAKFGGTSVADAAQFRKVKDIIQSSPERRFIVVSAPGKRFPEDVKVTDLLLDCYAKAVAGESFAEQLDQIRARFRSILDDLKMSFPLDDELEVLEQSLLTDPMEDYAASRGEYLTARIMAKYLGFTFVDPAWCVCFDEDGQLNAPMTSRTMRASLLPLNRAVIAGFYGADMNGTIHTFERGGSDITGSLAACAVGAHLYENWTDVSGLYAADPRIVDNPETVSYMSYRELRTLSYMGASVLHSDAVLSASEMEIPINIRNTNRPEDSGTMIVRHLPANVVKNPVTGEKATESSDANVRVLEKLTQEGIEISTINQGAGKLNLLIGVPEERYEDAIRAIYEFRQGM